MDNNFSVIENGLDLDIEKMWNSVLDKVAGEITAISFDVWVKSLEPVRVEGNSLVLLTKSASTKSVIENNYKKIIEKCLNEVHSALKLITIIIDEDEEKEIDKILPEPKKNIKELSAEEKFKFNPKYTFDNFVIGGSNQFAVAAAKAVAENPGEKYNPLFIYGGVGLGKTHILHAIGNYITKTKPNLNVIYVTIEQFTNDLIESIQNSKASANSDFRNKYRKADVLIVDDIQYIINKTSVQEEFFHTFNELNQAGKQIIISSDKSPKEINPLEERLRSRFEWGLLADIGFPSIETRIAILNKKAELERYNVSRDVIEYIAEAVKTNIREMEGLLSRSVFYAGLMGNNIVTMDTAREALKNFMSEKEDIPDSSHILDCVSKYFNISVKELTSKKRTKDIAMARQICMYLITDLLNMPLASVGLIFGKDHATVIYAKNKIIEDIKKNNKLKVQINDLRQMIKCK
ncbi:MAG: chromosomal replication initiator protein DnaA [Clostridia bacterium]